MSEELKACPFCGYKQVGIMDNYASAYISCPSCDTTIYHHGHLDTVSHWNTRLIEDALTAERDALAKQLEVATGTLRRIYHNIFDVDQTPSEFAGQALAEIERIGKEDKHDTG
jgi:hypothetical protein